MNICKIDGMTRVLNAPADWDHSKVECVGLPIFDHPDGWMVSAWQPTAEELKALKAGGFVRLWVGGTQHPVVSIEAVDADGAQQADSLATLKEHNRWLRQTLKTLIETLNSQAGVCQLALDATK